MRRSLESVEGVSGISVDFGAGTATFRVKQGVKDETLLKAIPERFTAKVKG